MVGHWRLEQSVGEAGEMKQGAGKPARHTLFLLYHGAWQSAIQKGELLSEIPGWTDPADKRCPEGRLRLHQPVRSRMKGTWPGGLFI